LWLGWTIFTNYTENIEIKYDKVQIDNLKITLEPKKNYVLLHCTAAFT